MTIQIDLPMEEIAELCRRYPVRRLSLFGSALRDDFRPDSDIDMLVEFEPGAKVTLFDLGGMQQELSALLGREVDIKTPGFISERFRQRVFDSAETLYGSH